MIVVTVESRDRNADQRYRSLTRTCTEIRKASAGRIPPKPWLLARGALIVRLPKFGYPDALD